MEDFKTFCKFATPIIEDNMETSSTYTLNIPSSDNNLFHSLVRRFGWTAKKKREQHITHLDAAIKAAHEEDLFETNDIDTLMKSLTE